MLTSQDQESLLLDKPIPDLKATPTKQSIVDIQATLKRNPITSLDLKYAERVEMMIGRLNRCTKTQWELLETTQELQNQTEIQKQELILIENEQIRSLKEIKDIEKEVAKIGEEKNRLMDKVLELKKDNEEVEALKYLKDQNTR